MNMDKYRALLFQKIKRQLKEWFETESLEHILNEEVYRFLHSIKGTAGTIELLGLHQLASELMEKIEEDSNKEWTKEELTDFLYHLIGLSYEYEHFREESVIQEIERSEQAKLIQIIDDDLSILILLKDALEARGWMVVAHTDPVRAVSQFYDLHPDCLVIDINLPNQNGLQLLESFESYSPKKFIPKLIISIDDNRENRLDAYKLGADDFIQKPIDIEEFIIRVERQLKRKHLFDQSVLIDELTQVYNRKFLQDSLERSLHDVKRMHGYFSIAVLDLDHFKKINDTYGHLVGDRVLIYFARFLKEHTRSSDIVFRYGGEEFIIIFPSTTDEEAVDVLTRILGEFSEKTFAEGDQLFSATFSAGVYLVTNGEETPNSIIHAADQALYIAKKRGRRRVLSANTLHLGDVRKKIYVSVVDDDAIIRTILMKTIKSIPMGPFNLDIKVFEDGAQFFEEKREQEEGPHFVILDGVMPVMDGNEVLRKLKEGEIAQQFHVLMLTGRKSEADIAEAIKRGADDYVTKPFNVRDLQMRMERFIHRMA